MSKGATMGLTIRDRLEAMADELHFLDGSVEVNLRDEWGYVYGVYSTKPQAMFAAGVLADMAGMSTVEITIEQVGDGKWKTKLTFRHASLLNGM